LDSPRKSALSFLLRHLGPALPVLALLLALEATGIDSAISGWFFDPVAGAFPLRHNSLLEVLGHQWTRQLVTLTACCVVALYALSFVLADLRPHRRLLLFLSLSLALAPLSVTLLKAASSRHCPWSLWEFGGSAPHLSLFDAAPPGSPPGHCFPSGHASAGFALWAFYFAGRTLGSRRLARVGLWGGLAAGMAFGTVRVAQGAHFLSHNLWSALVCWLVILALYVAVMGTPKERAGAGI
jgi:membrane-associated PAP2 superfamily phosphatase